MKASSLNALTRFLYGDSICVLCLNKIKDNFVHVDDLVAIQRDNQLKGETTSLSNILCTVLNTRESAFESKTKVCEICFQNAMQSYKFIKQCHNSAEINFKAVNLLIACLDAAHRKLHKENSLCLNLDLEKNKFDYYYDKKKSQTTSQSKLRFVRTKTKKQFKKNQFETESDIANIETVNIPENDINYQCKHCVKTFLSSKGLKAHQLRVHAPKDFNCSKCTRKFGSAYLLKLHKSKSHITVICSECGKTYNNMHSLKLHESGHNLKQTCPSCGSIYRHRISFERHYKQCKQGLVKVSFEKFICDICSKEYSQKSSLRTHISFEHGNGKSFSCYWCKKKFPAKSKLNAHIVKHTKARNFICNTCGGQFVTKESLLYHTRIHTGETPYACGHCDDKFISASRRMDHIRRKHIGATLECDMCNKKFNTPLCLKKHKMRHSNPNSSLFIK